MCICIWCMCMCVYIFLCVNLSKANLSTHVMFWGQHRVFDLSSTWIQDLLLFTSAQELQIGSLCQLYVGSRDLNSSSVSLAIGRMQIKVTRKFYLIPSEYQPSRKQMTTNVARYRERGMDRVSHWMGSSLLSLISELLGLAYLYLWVYRHMWLCRVLGI